MHYTRHQLSKIKELEFQSDVLVPLFKKMGFQDVHLYHGGSLEQGKDIVMWKAGEFGERVNFAVVVKVGRITGQAGGKGSAQEVVFQINQCFSSSFYDKRDGRKLSVDKVYVVTNAEIKKEAFHALEGQLVNKNVTYLDGDKVWEYIEQYFPNKQLLERVNEVTDELMNFNPNWGFNLLTRQKERFYYLVPKHAKAHEAQPIVIKGNFHFPPTPEGNEVKQRYINFIKKGDSLEISKEYFEGFDLPDFLKEVMGFKKEKLLFIPLQIDPHTFPISVEFTARDGNYAKIQNLELRIVKSGTEQTTVSNFHQNHPFKLELIWDKGSKKTTISYESNLKGKPLKQAIDVINFYQAASVGGTLIIRNCEDDEILVTMEIDESDVVYNKFWTKVYQSLYIIQQKTKVRFTIPDTPIEYEECKDILEVAEKVTKGITTSPINWYSINLPLKDAKNFYEKTKTGEYFAFAQNYEWEKQEILGRTLELGSIMHLLCPSTYDKEDVLRQIQANTEEVKFTMRPHNGANLYTFYKKWLPEDVDFTPNVLVEKYMQLNSSNS